jgi:hypothetical protein
MFITDAGAGGVGPTEAVTNACVAELAWITNGRGKDEAKNCQRLMS